MSNSELNGKPDNWSVSNVDNYHRLFPKKKAVIGKTYLYGSTQRDKIKRTLEDIRIFSGEGFDATLIEARYGDAENMVALLEKISDNPILSKDVGNLGIRLPNDYSTAMQYASIYPIIKFIHLELIAGEYERDGKTFGLDAKVYSASKNIAGNLVVLGGVWPIGYVPIDDSDLSKDLNTAKRLAESVVITASSENNAFDYMKLFRKDLGDNYPLIIGNEVSDRNIRTFFEPQESTRKLKNDIIVNIDTVKPADGIMIGKHLRTHGTGSRLYLPKIKEFMKIVEEYTKN